MTTRPSPPSRKALRWTGGSTEPRLDDEGALHVWRADLSAVADDLGELLSPAERARAESFLSARDRRRWTRAHGVLRALLGRYLGSDPRALRISAAAHGKPALSDSAPASRAAAGATQAAPGRLSFNMSHSGQLALYAFTRSGAVGVDVEVARRPINEVALAARVFGAAEAKRLEALDPASRERAFLRLWVRHEAELKYRGTGIGGNRVVDGTPAESEARAPWIADLDVGPRAAGAVAVPAPPPELHRWDWRD